MFKFRLQRLLELRSKREQETATQLARARSQAEAARAAYESLAAARSESRERLQGAVTGAPSVGQLQHLSYVLERLDQRITEAGETMQSAEEDVRRTQGEFDAAFKNRRVLDKLRERHLEAWRTDEVQDDRRHMDGIALAQFTRAKIVPSKREG